MDSPSIVEPTSDGTFASTPPNAAKTSHVAGSPPSSVATFPTPSPSAPVKIPVLPPPSPQIRSRTALHSLSSASTVSSSAGRKGSFATPDTSAGNAIKANISMPPLSTRPQTNNRASGAARRLSMASDSIYKMAETLGIGGTERRRVSLQEDSGAAVTASAPGAHFLLPESRLQYAPTKDGEWNRKSSSSLGSMQHGIATGGEQSPIASSPLDTRMKSQAAPASAQPETMSSTTATTPLSITTSSAGPYIGLPLANVHQLMTKDQNSILLGPSSIASQTSQASSGSGSGQGIHMGRGHGLSHHHQLPTRSRSRTKRRLSSSTGASSNSPSGERGIHGRDMSEAKTPLIGKIGICALDVKARSKPSRNILGRLIARAEFEVIVFGDKVILDESVENWPVCDFLISFFSAGFPLDKAIAYTHLRKPFCVNDLPMQNILWDRRICLRILDKIAVPTPKRIEVNRDGGPTIPPDLAMHLFKKTGVRLEGPEDGTGGGAPVPRKVELLDDGDTLYVDGTHLKKPFVEKPVSGEDHNIRIYYPKSQGGGGRKLFRKVGNKSSEWDPNLTAPRAITEHSGSYIYEQFLRVDNSEDVKAYTVGTNFVHAETRKSPVVDGLVRRNTHGKEIRYITALTKEELGMAARIAEAFGQRVCGFDLLRVDGKSYVIDVNGWSFVKDNNEYYDKCANILRKMFIQEKERREGKAVMPPVVETSAEMEIGSNGRQSWKSTGGHRSALQTLLGRSPSITRLSNYRHHHHNSGAGHGQIGDGTLPDLLTSTAPISSPPSFGRTSAPRGPAASTSSDANLRPSPSSTPTADTPRSSNPSPNIDETAASVPPPPEPKHSWKLKGMVAVIRHADRTPKQKFKFTFHTKPFIDLLKGHQEEVLLVGETALDSVMEAVKVALKEGIEDLSKLKLLRTSLARKGGWPGTKVQIKPLFRKRKPDEMAMGFIPEPAEGESAEGPPAEVVTSSAAMASPPIRSSEGEGLLSISRPPTRSDSLTGVTLSRIAAAENNLILDKLQLIIKWGGEPTHSARYQSQDLGENMRNDMLLMNRSVLDDVSIYTSSERRVSTSAQIWATSFTNRTDIPDDFLVVRKDLLDDSNAAKDEMDRVKKKLKSLLREGMEAAPQFAWPKGTPEPSVVLGNVVELMKFHRRVMRHNYTRLFGGVATSSLAAIANPRNQSPAAPPSLSVIAQAQAVSSIQARWCCGEDAELFRERWEKLFVEFCDTDKVDPSKISELYDTMKYDALHNRQFLETIFTPDSTVLDEDACSATTGTDKGIAPTSQPDTRKEDSKPHPPADVRSENPGKPENSAKATSADGQKGRFGRLSNRVPSTTRRPSAHLKTQQSYFNLFTGSVHAKAKMDIRLEKLRELYKLAKVLFDFVGPQEYGITNDEKLEIGLLTSLPLLKEIVKDLEYVQASDNAKSFVYFTKESHIYTLLNCIVEGGIQTKIERSAIPELDYLSQICFELYESENKTPADAGPEEPNTFAYSIRISISPGCHTFDPLDLQLDSKHCIGCAPRRSLTPHLDWKEVIETLRDNFQR
ncbi:hypothetical protein FGG08_004045 [Glutinoglossum americanum]|uniref:Inositol hexakisphosphate and diphosphoinositol-pentakisphosphate kinase n=1 Tax=Glutinoglossum americanum TaxID=1670608 RepID=A0A9P8I643_9PEZI|nr:hypothetical protein FGG08_004045 [Glutinoglossum americanum]